MDSSGSKSVFSQLCRRCWYLHWFSSLAVLDSTSSSEEKGHLLPNADVRSRLRFLDSKPDQKKPLFFSQYEKGNERQMRRDVLDQRSSSRHEM